MKIEEEKRIIKKIKEVGILGNVSLYPPTIDIAKLSFDDEHIKIRNHNVTKDDAKHFIKTARFSSLRWKGKFLNFYSDDGAAFVDLENNNIRTAFSKAEFTDEIIKALEVLSQYEK